MPDVAIQVSGLSKRFQIGADRGPYKTLRESLGDVVRAPFRIFSRSAGSDGTTFWALKDVDFAIERGEVVGVIGRNGAGKSTLLKILSRIVEPTTGRIEILGRVGSLLEVGTGFHPELSGRENIHMNGAILGMSRAEIRSKFDEIVAFSEIGKFIDTPVKRYSSGMYTRLAFAVAAHLEPEILIVDEVLAVGDAQFQQKCLGKMRDVAGTGRTVIFVSHNMNAIRDLCRTAIILDRGRVVAHAPVNVAVPQYLATSYRGETTYAPVSPPSSRPHVASASVTQGNDAGPAFAMDLPVSLTFHVVTAGNPNLVLGVKIYNDSGVCLLHTSDEFAWDAGQTTATTRICTLPPYAFAEGKYLVEFGLSHRNYEVFEVVDNALSFEVRFAGKLAGRTQGHEWHGVYGPGLPDWKLS